ncbi:hypothetical protein HAX54_001755 [Datura stramonium]|uniref:Uncharacterized protein n=1 Tax=Datura stramonium TaxID=4076 RepID=A0ABS8RSV0_DATST|nr:hypothetical protein [Datura stramonium]
MTLLFLKAKLGRVWISYGKPTNVHVRGVRLQSAGAGMAFGSEMSGGGISNLLVASPLRTLLAINVSIAGSFTGLSESPFTSICLSNVTFSISSNPTPWLCSDVSGSSQNVSPEPCPELKSSFSSTTSTCCFPLTPPQPGCSFVSDTISETIQ